MHEHSFKLSSCYDSVRRPTLSTFGCLLALTILAGINCGCTGASSAQVGGGLQTYSLSGQITPVAAGNGATVTISGPLGTTVTADSSGKYAFAGLTNGTYILTPTHSGFSFTPASQSITVSGANASVPDFAASSATFSISGTITGVSGATVALSGASSATTTADGSGNFRFNNLANGNYTVMPSKAGLSFTPANKAVTINNANVTGVTFSATAQTYSISGNITGAGGSGATVTLSGSAATTTTTDGFSNFTFSKLVNGNYALVATKTGYIFSPTTQAVTINGANVTGVSFTSSVAPTTHSISGTINPATAGSGATVTLTGSTSAVATANASGNFTFTSLTNGSYTVTPTSSTATMSPASQIITINNADVTGVNFTATATAQVVFFDDFLGTTLDATKWVALNRHGDYSNNELQCYLPANVSVGSGYLNILSQAQTQTCGDANHSPIQWNYTSGMVQWSNFNFTYGTVEFRAKMAGGQGTWPAIWLLGANCQTTNQTTSDNTGSCSWPDPGSDEIDITEIKNANLTTVWQNVISGGSGFQTCTPTTADVSQNWHVYQLVWGAGSLIWKIDGTQTCKFTSNIPSNPMFLMINTAIGGSGGGVNNSTLPQTLQVDYVKVSQP